VAFLALAIASAAGLFGNPYAGLVIFVALPALFLLGLLLIPAGMWLQQRRRRRDPTAEAEWPVLDFRKPKVRRVALVIAALTTVNIVIILLAGYGSLHWMDSPSFCGQVCHTPMHPQFTAWQESPHARVRCVDCHIGEGAGAMVHYKLAGVRQLVHVITNNYPRPIPSVADMRPALEVCGNCHDPRRAFGERTRVIREYADDESNSETETVLLMHVGGPGRPTAAGRAIHWHADPSVRIEYIATDNARQTIPYVKVTDARGRVKEYTVKGTTRQQLSRGEHRVMDCVDCHNTIGHRIVPTAEKAVDLGLASGRIDRRLPFVRREAVRLVKLGHSRQDTGLIAIERGLREFYKSRNDPADQQRLARAISVLQDTYRHNVFPTMKVTWGTYPDNRGHVTSNGCFRCHDDSHLAGDGSTISGECEYCHAQSETSS
jgi:hypothetical protein